MAIFGVGDYRGKDHHPITEEAGIECWPIKIKKDLLGRAKRASYQMISLINLKIGTSNLGATAFKKHYVLSRISYHTNLFLHDKGSRTCYLIVHKDVLLIRSDRFLPSI